MGFIKRNSIELKFFAVFFLFAAALTQCSVSPLIYPDEAGYIGWVYKLIYGSGDGLRYLPGYSFLISPAFLICDGIRTAFMLVTLINSALYGLFAAFCLKISKVFDFENPLLCAAAVALYPSVAIYANLALCEVLLSFIFVAMLYFVYRLSENTASKTNWAMLILLAVYACMTHSRAVGLIPAVILAIAPAVFSKGSKRMKVIFSAICAVGVLCVVGLFLYLLAHSETVNAAHMLVQMKNLLSPQGFINFITTLISQFSYLEMATYGFLVVGIYYAFSALRDEKLRSAAMFSLLSICFAAIISAVFLYHHERPDHIIYGRYNEYVLSGIMLFGISGFLKSGAKRRLLLFSLLSGVITGALYSKTLVGLDNNLCHTWGIYLYKAFFFKFSYIEVFALFFLVSAVLFLIKKPKITVALLCVLFAVGIIYTEYDYFYNGAQPRQEYPQLASLLKDEKTVSADVIEGDSMVYPWEYYNYTVYNKNLSFKENSRYTLCRKRRDDMVLIGKEKYSPVYLYAKDGTAVDETGEPRASVTVTASDDNYIAVTYENLGAPWLCLDSADDTVSAVRAGMRVYKDGVLIDDVRRDFADNVYEKAGVIFDFPYENGEYTVIIETIREFKFRGGELSLSVNVSEDGIDINESNAVISAGFTEFDPLQIKGAEGFYRYYVMPSGAKLTGLYLNGSYLTIETFGEHEQLDVKVLGNGKPLEFISFDGKNYVFEISEPIEELEIRSSTYKYCDNALSFLTTESNIKAVDYFVRGMKKVFDVRLDHRDYGVDIKKIHID